jgi:hypothetical protein
MAKQMGGLKLRGTIDNLTFYKLRGNYYVRTKSSLTGERVKTELCFRPLMAYASLLAEASKIASAVYRLLRPKRKKIKFYRQMTGRAMSWLKQGMRKEKIVELLKKERGLPLSGNSCKGKKNKNIPQRRQGATLENQLFSLCAAAPLRVNFLPEGSLPGILRMQDLDKREETLRERNNVVSQPYRLHALPAIEFLPRRVPRQ